MHTEQPEAFLSIPAFAPYRGRVAVAQDGEPLPLDTL